MKYVYYTAVIGTKISALYLPPTKEYKQLQKQLSSFFNTNIEMKRNNKGKGNIVIPFSSDEELERIMGIFDKLNT